MPEIRLRRHVLYRELWILCVLLLLSLLITACSQENLDARVPFSSSARLQTITITPEAPSISLINMHNEAENKLTEFQNVLQWMMLDGVDITGYRQQYHKDQSAFQSAQTINALASVLNQLNAHLSPTVPPIAQALAQYRIQQFHQEVITWGVHHQYHDPYDQQNYPFDYEYMSLPGGYGSGSSLDRALQTAHTVAGYQAVMSQVNNDQVLLTAMEDNLQDATTWQQSHRADQRLLRYFHATQGQVIVVSLTEQVLRLYRDGKLIRAFQVVTGLYQRPTPPGLFHINTHAEVSLFLSFDEPGGKFYFPPTEVYYTLNFGIPGQGYFLHASPWRTYYGPGNNFPHYDPLNKNSESRNGSHGCVNLPLDQEQWLYHRITDGTDVIIY